MSLVYVGLPVLLYSRRFHFDRGRRWNVIEHIVLQAIAARPQTVRELVDRGKLPKRVVIEVLIRLMRAGWVEMRAGAEEVTFLATKRGVVVAADDELPAITERKTRRMSFAVDRITGGVFRRRDLTLMRRDEWDKRLADFRTVIIPKPVRTPADMGAVSALLDALFDEDEQLVRVDVGDQPPAERLALFAVRGGKAEGLPPRVTSHLRLEIENASRQAPRPGGPAQGPVEVIVAASVPNMRPERQTHVRRDDVIAGGPAHEAHILNALKKARDFVIIHSTFLDRQRFEALLPALRTTAARRCKVDILWGEAPQVRTETAKALKESAAIRERIHQVGLSGLVEVHNFSTRSHSKLLVADDGAGAITATVGSCNWLYSGFGSFELSFRLRDPHLVADALFETLELARPPDQQIPEIAARLGELARGLRRRPPLQGSARVRLLVGEEHDDRVLQARDHAQREITVLSHRLGVTARPSILVPVASAVAARKITASLFYGQSSGAVDATDASDTRWQMKDQGVELIAVQRPRLHAKALMWDEDHLAISSMNWLSADTPASNPRQEIGVYVEANGLARLICDEFKGARMLG